MLYLNKLYLNKKKFNRGAVKSLSFILIFLIIFPVLLLCGCGDKKEEPKKDDKPKKVRPKRTKKTAAKKSTAESKNKSTSKAGGKSKRRGTVKVEELVIQNPDRIEDLLKAKDYKYGNKYNIFKDYVLRERERVDTDGDGIPDIYDDDDDGDGFPDSVEIAEGFDPLNKYSHPERSSLIGAGAIAGSSQAGAGASGSAGTSKPGKDSKTGSRSRGKSKAGPQDQPIEETQTAGIYFRGLFGIRNNKVAVLKVVKDERDDIILKREGEKFLGISKGTEYLLEEINLLQEFIKVRDIKKDNIIKLSFQKDKKEKAKPEQPGPGAQKKSSKKRRAPKAPKKK
jgi:hypothetical protein